MERERLIADIPYLRAGYAEAFLQHPLIAAMPRQEYLSRVGIFLQVRDSLEKNIEGPIDQIQGDAYRATRILRLTPHLDTFLTSPQIEGYIRFQDTTLPERVLTLHSNRSPKQMLTYGLIDGFAEVVHSYTNRAVGVRDKLRRALIETIVRDYPDSFLAQDLDKQEQDMLLVKIAITKPQEPQLHDVPVAFAPTAVDPSVQAEEEEVKIVISFNDAFAEGQSGPSDLPHYNNVYELGKILNDLQIDNFSLRRNIIDYDSGMMWDAWGVLSYVREGASMEQRNFGLTFLSQEKDALIRLERKESQARDNNDATSTIFEVMNIPSLNQKIWWMFAPYIYDELQMHEQQFNPAEALQRIMLWASEAETHTKISFITNRITLPGLQFLNRYRSRIASFRLSRDPGGLSHEFVRQEAQKIAQLLLEDPRFDPDKAFG